MLSFVEAVYEHFRRCALDAHIVQCSLFSVLDNFLLFAGCTLLRIKIYIYIYIYIDLDSLELNRLDVTMWLDSLNNCFLVLLDVHLPVHQVKRHSNDMLWIRDQFRQYVWQALLVFNPHLSISTNRQLFIDINRPKWITSMNKWITDIDKGGVIINIYKWITIIDIDKCGVIINWLS